MEIFLNKSEVVCRSAVRLICGELGVPPVDDRPGLRTYIYIHYGDGNGADGWRTGERCGEG